MNKKLTIEEKAFLRCLPTGRDNARTAYEIGGLIHRHIGYRIGERRIRKIASGLRRKGHLIASSPRSPYGFYRPANLEEAEDCRDQLARRLRELRRTVVAFDTAVRRELFAQRVERTELPGLERGA